MMKFALSGLSVLLLLGLSGQSRLQAGPANPFEPDFGLVGFATVSGYGVETTTGGNGGQLKIVHNAQEFREAVERLDITDKKLRDQTPRMVQLANDIDLGPLANEKPGSEIKSVGVVRVASNTTIYAPGEGATIRHGVVEVAGAHNIVIRNLKFRDLWENDPTGAYDDLGWDYIRITNSGKILSHHVWVDHCDFGKVYDGMLDITHGSDLVTVSWCHFAGDEHGPQKKCSLIGHSSSATAVAVDKGHLNVTFHHNWFENIGDRAPRARTGNIHIFNDVVDGAENATISVAGAVTLVENCLYRDTRIATSFSHDKDSVSRKLGGIICIVDSQNENPRPLQGNDSADKRFENSNNFKSSVARPELQFNPAAGFAWKNLNALPYSYKADAVDKLEELVKQYAGTGKLGVLLDTNAAPFN